MLNLRKSINMRSRIYMSVALFFALTMFNGKKAKAYNSENPEGHFVTANRNTVPVNYIFTGVVLGIAGIGLIAIKNAKTAINAKLRTQRQQGY
jgi:hypothetical protein